MEGARFARNALLHREPTSRLARAILHRSIAWAVWRQDAKLGSILLQARPSARAILGLDVRSGSFWLLDPD
eukprot:5003362-Pyramimonas_sp.AAC.2